MLKPGLQAGLYFYHFAMEVTITLKPLYCCSEYTVDSDGFVISKRGKPLKPSLNQHGYQIINLMIDGRRVGMSVHSAVARTFLDGYRPGLQVNHKDGNKTNNVVTNLEWMTQLENTRYTYEVLGYDCSGANNCMAKRVLGYDKITGELKFTFGSMREAGRYFSPENLKRASSIANVISQVVNHRNGKKSYRGCVWVEDAGVV